MGKRSFLVIPALTLVLVILMEDPSLSGVVTGLVISTAVVLFTAKFLPLQIIADIKFIKLVTFPFYLIGQIYVAGFQVIRVILKAPPKIDIITVKTKIKSEALRVILVDSITLTPGSILLNLDEDNVTLLWLRDKDTPPGPEEAYRQLMQRLEHRLLTAQKEG
jgi:multicomponent Na+:H+ antiporter subunit E